MATALHFGVLPADDQMVDEDFVAVVKAALERDGGVFVTDGDSFNAWGEKISGPDEALHVVARFGNTDGVPHGIALLYLDDLADAVRERIGSARVMDYVMATDDADWSESVRVTGFGALSSSWLG